MSDPKLDSDSNVNNENEQPDFVKPNLSAIDIEKAEEAKLKAKYQFKAGPPMGGHSSFLQKKLAKGQKYFDSGDYQMAKQTNSNSAAMLGGGSAAGGEGGLLGNKQMLPPGGGKLTPSSLGFGTGDAIPTPESVPIRKTSIQTSKPKTLSHFG